MADQEDHERRAFLREVEKGANLLSKSLEELTKALAEFPTGTIYHKKASEIAYDLTKLIKLARGAGSRKENLKNGD